MARGSQLGLLLLLLCSLSASSDEGVSVETVTVTEGEDSSINFSTSERFEDIRDVTVEWKRNGSIVLLFRDGRLYFLPQDLSFKNRVGLASPELKNGDLSINLRKTQFSDSGVYQCLFYKASSRKRREATEPHNTVNLKVQEKSSESGSAEAQTETTEGPSLGLTVGLTIMGLVLSVTAVVLFGVFLRLRKRPNQMELTETSEESNPLSL